MRATAFVALAALFVALGTSNGADFDPFDDSVRFHIAYNVERPNPEFVSAEVPIQTAENGKYVCYLPKKPDTSDEGLNKISPLLHPSVLLSALKGVCLYRQDSYWSYEYCHGQHLRQYHDAEKSGVPGGKTMSFVLGQSMPESRMATDPLASAAGAGADAGAGTAPDGGPPEVPQLEYEGKMVPYYSVMLTDGTMCDLTGKPRTTDMRFICSPYSNHQFPSLAESSTCTYIAIVATPLLCRNPLYVVRDEPVNSIVCVSDANDGRAYRNIVPERMSAEAALLRQQQQHFQLTPDDNAQQKAQQQTSPQGKTPSHVSAATTGQQVAGKAPTVHSQTPSHAQAGKPPAVGQGQGQTAQTIQPPRAPPPAQQATQGQQAAGTQAHRQPQQPPQRQQPAHGTEDEAAATAKARETFEQAQKIGERQQQRAELKKEAALKMNAAREGHTTGLFDTGKNDQPAQRRSPAEIRVIVDRFVDQCYQGIFRGGYWQYEFCYGRHVRQFHGAGLTQQDIILGKWDERAHRYWHDSLSTSQKLGFFTADHTTLRLTHGTTCPETGLARYVDVRLVCGMLDKPSAVTLSLDETEICAYRLTVVSAAACYLIENVDAYHVPIVR